MLTNGFPEEIKRLCSLICGDDAWFVWVDSRTETRFISAEVQRPCSVEERVLLKIPGQQHRESVFSLPDSHLLLSSTGYTGKLLFLQCELDQTQLLIALPAGKQLLLEKLLLLILDRHREWQLRQQLSKLVEQQQQQIRAAEERLRALHQQRAQQVRQLLNDWLISKTPLTVVADESLYTCFDFSMSDHDIRSQLEGALQLAQFIQPGSTHYQLSAVHIQPVEMPEKTAVNAPLNSNQRVELLLDKYEASARTARQKGLVVNGKTIAENLQPSISPPAITDALKKNRKAISGLLEEYPEKWGLLRKHLKPVKELSERAFYRSFDANS
jgi:hypothetical protein